MKSEIKKWRHSLSQHYDRSLDEVPVYPLTDDPTMAKLREVYIRTDICKAPKWPPIQSNDTFTDYSSIFSKSSPVSVY